MNISLLRHIFEMLKAERANQVSKNIEKYFQKNCILGDRDLHLHHASKIKSHTGKEVTKKSTNEGFSFSLKMEGSGRTPNLHK
jgi:hypothetical protein